MTVRIKERSLLARIAAWQLGAHSVALTWGYTIHLHRADAAALLKDEAWLRHELKHVEQFRRHGRLTFLVLYLWETLRRGYFENRFEVEARAAEMSTLAAADPFHFTEGQRLFTVPLHQEAALTVNAPDQHPAGGPLVSQFDRTAPGVQ